MKRVQLPGYIVHVDNMQHTADYKWELNWYTSHQKSPSAEVDFILMAYASLIYRALQKIEVRYLRETHETAYQNDDCF